MVLDVYPARERAEDHPGVSGLLIARATADAGGGQAGVLDAELRGDGAVLRGMLGEPATCAW